MARAAAPIVPPLPGFSEKLSLFNGHNLDGWDFTDCFWSVRDGVIVAQSSEPVLTSTYCLTKRHFTDFRLKVAVKLSQSEMHSGISLWGHVPAPQHGEAHTYAGHLVMLHSCAPAVQCTWPVDIERRRGVRPGDVSFELGNVRPQPGPTERGSAYDRGESAAGEREFASLTSGDERAEGR